MKSDVIAIDNKGNGFRSAVEETKKAAGYGGLSDKQSLRLQLMAEEMLSMARIVTGEMKASFWVEGEGKKYSLHMTTKTNMNPGKRYELISSSTSKRNDAAKGFLGMLRDAFEQAMTVEVVHDYQEIPLGLYYDAVSAPLNTLEWDGYERSVLRRLADDIRIGIRGEIVEMTVAKDFTE